MSFALGVAHAEPIPPGTNTFELRLWNPALNQDTAVIGRVSVVAGTPTMLPAPGQPVEVRETNQMSAKGDLNIKLRWATPDPLRRITLLQYGFNVYRMTKAFAELPANNFHLSPPATATLLALATNGSPAVKRVNNLPVLADKDFTAAAVANFALDPATFFTADDNQRFQPNVPADRKSVV